uniref:Testis-expressed sequence 2 protein-like n=1 Tax=Sinocyclocheilus anshuiensis TaxID=1608454 RepID=A0A671KJ50_9TELE
MFQSHPRQKDLDASLKQKVLEYNVYMAKYVSQSAGSPTTSPDQSAGSSPGIVKKFPASREQESESEAWVNALLGRIVWDFLGEKYWADVVSKKIQKKLSKIRLPYFMNELTLTELDMGISIPKILNNQCYSLYLSVVIMLCLIDV